MLDLGYYQSDEFRQANCLPAGEIVARVLSMGIEAGDTRLYVVTRIEVCVNGKIEKIIAEYEDSPLDQAATNEIFKVLDAAWERVPAR